MKNMTLEDKFIKKATEIAKKTDFGELARSYKAPKKSYAVTILKRLHKAFVKVYESEYIDSKHEMIYAPAVIKNVKTGEILIGLVCLDILSSGEHCGTIFFTELGVMDDEDTKLSTKHRSYLENLTVPYDYWYTINLKRDHHVDFNKAPADVVYMINKARE